MIRRIFAAVIVVVLCLQGRALAQTVVSHFSMGEADPVGGLADSVGSNDMTLISGAPMSGPASPAPGSTASVFFDGATRFEVDHPITAGITGEGYSLEAWVQPETHNENQIILSDGHGGAGALIFQNGEGFGLAMGGAGGFWTVGATPAVIGQWHHLVLTRDLAGSVSLTVDGADQLLADPGIGTRPWADFAAIGDQGSGGFGFTGFIDSVTYSLVPEPTGFALATLAGLVLLSMRKKR